MVSDISSFACEGTTNNILDVTSFELTLQRIIVRWFLFRMLILRYTLVGSVVIYLQYP